MRNSAISMRHSQSSPSVSIEKGTYRIHAPKRSPSKLGYIQNRHSRLTMHEKRVAVLIVFLVLATVLCFGFAYYLFTTRWESYSVRSQGPASDSPQPLQVVEFEHDSCSEAGDKSTKYLSYLPHSGFHNQRIALENALVMAHLLDRTLLIPPVRLGKGIVTYFPFDDLYKLVATSGKDRLSHCANVHSWKSLPVECTEYFEYTLVSWSWLSNLSSISINQPLLYRWNMSDFWLRDCLGISLNDTFSVKDMSLYHHRFVDADPFDMPSARFNDSVSISLLAQVPHRLLQIGSLFGSSRLRLRRHHDLEIRARIRESMVFSNKLFLDIADSINSSLGGVYLAAHIRLGDWQFIEKGEKNVRLIWWKLVHDIAGLGKDEAADLEMLVTNSSKVLKPPVYKIDLAALRSPIPPLPPVSPRMPTRIACRGSWHMNPRFAALNAPLFISTDVSDPFTNVLLRKFFDTFPCTFVLSDFVDEIAPINLLRSGYDGLMLKEFLLPFLDAIVAGKAYQLVGTEGSTFSQFVQDVLWRHYHGWEVVQRG